MKSSFIKATLSKITDSSGSKWGEGLGLLWRGNNSTLYLNALKSCFIKSSTSDQNQPTYYLILPTGGGATEGFVRF